MFNGWSWTSYPSMGRGVRVKEMDRQTIGASIGSFAFHWLIGVIVMSQDGPPCINIL